MREWGIHKSMEAAPAFNDNLNLLRYRHVMHASSDEKSSEMEYLA